LSRKSVRSRQKIAAIGLAIVAVAGLGMASAAQLTVIDTTVVAGVSTDSPCDTAVTVTFNTSFSTTLHAYAISSVTISGINMTASPPVPSCSGKTLDFTLLDNSAGVVATGVSTTISGVSHTIAISPTPANANSVAQIAIVIY